MGLIVQKFGGSSVATPEKIHNCARRALVSQAAGNQVVMVVSAMGDTTDDLLALADRVCLGQPMPKRELDMLLSTGEQVSIALVAMAIEAQGGKAISLTGPQVGLKTDMSYTRARIQSIEGGRLREYLDSGRVVIVAGFQGINEVGDVTTLGRGGSDTTAVAIAAAMGADTCEIYTDVKGIYTTDPRKVPSARLLKTISYDELLELASVGGGKMHSRSIEFGKKYGIKIHVRHSELPDEGTLIIEETEAMEDITVRGLALTRNLARVTLRNVPDRPGVAATVFGNVARAGIVVDDIVQTEMPGGVAHISFTFNSNEKGDIQPAIERVLTNIGGGEAVYQEGLAKISAVGVGMRSHTGVAERMFSALAAAGVNIQNITTSEIRISVIINADDGEKALNVVHEAFGLGQASA